MSNSKLVMSQAANSWEGPTYIEDVFSTYLYTGTGAALTITNGIDLAGEGGLVWVKTRSTAGNHLLFDTQRGTGRWLETNSTGAENGAVNTVTFNSTGFTGTSSISVNAATYASWTFRKAPRFFDVVTYTGTGSVQNIAHNLGVVPGCIIVKRLDSSSFNWQIYHRGSNAAPEDYRLEFTTDAAQLQTNVWGSTAPTSTHFTVGVNGDSNGSGGSLVAYLFAHDPLGPSGDGSDGLIACGSYTGTGANNNVVTLGWEPQWVMVKNATTGGTADDGWWMVDNMRGWAVNGSEKTLQADISTGEASYSRIDPTATGFTLTSGGEFNQSGDTYIYIAIRRGPMREPTSGTEVFAAAFASASGQYTATAGFPVDLAIYNSTEGSGNFNFDRIRGIPYLRTHAINAETASSGAFDSNVNFRISATGDFSAYINWMFRRAPGFFDVVAYAGDGVLGRTVSHNLGVAPEMMIVKGRTDTEYWRVFHSGLPSPKDDFLYLNDTASTVTSIEQWNSTLPTTTEFSLSGNGRGVNDSVDTYIAYLFATLPGVSKVGSYTGNGSSQTINCGFTGGARFVLIKRTDSTGDWYVWDTTRGIVSGNDPHLSLNTTAAQVTTDDTIDPDSSGFIVNQVSATNVNVSSASYIYLAIA